MTRIRIEAGDATEAVAGFITAELSDAELDQIEVDREIAPTEFLASEPMTIAVTFVLSPLVSVAILGLLERWLEKSRQERAIELVLDGFDRSSDAGRAAAQLAQKHTEVSIRHGYPTSSLRKWFSWLRRTK